MDNESRDRPSAALPSRRRFLASTALAIGAGATLGLSRAMAFPGERVASELVETSLADLRARLERGATSVTSIARGYLRRIAALDAAGPALRSVLDTSPDVLVRAREHDRALRRVPSNGGPSREPLPPLYGLPILLKDNIDTVDLPTTAGSLVLEASRPGSDATVVERLRAAGAIVLGKSNLSEWANFRSPHASSGWSARGGQTRNPYALDRSPSGSSSGSCVAVAASLCAAALGTETNGSILMPAAMNGVVGIKPTVGLTSRAGVIPISDAQDTVGPIARTVADAALVLGALVGPDPRDEATATSAGRVFQDYTRFLDPEGLRGARIGVPRNGFWGFSPEADAVMEESLATLADAGAILVDPADIPSMDDLLAHGRTSPVLNVEFREHLRRYLATRVGPHPATVEQVIAENIRMADVELGFFGQEWLEAAAQAPPITDAVYRRALARGRRLAREDGIDAIMRRHRLDALVCSTNPLPWVIDRLVGDHTRELSYSTTPFAVAGYPAVTVPAGTRFGLPLGIHFGGSAWSEPRLVKLAYAFEQRRNARRPPTYPAGIS